MYKKCINPLYLTGPMPQWISPTLTLPAVLCCYMVNVSVTEIILPILMSFVQHISIYVCILFCHMSTFLPAFMYTGYCRHSYLTF
ncbi:hypothetical protein XENTR_v10020394 [Xenopus tropicalis]|nr:hypothetical protein XENTR_v10020394 [Xenopus tropicalis]